MLKLLNYLREKTMKTMKVKKPVVKRAKATSSGGHFVTKEQLLEAIVEDKKTGVLSERLAKYLFMIAERYSFSPSFAGYSFREDMVSYAAVNLYANWHKFDPEQTDQPFSYFTTAAYRSFLQVIAAEKKQRDIRDVMLIEAGSNPSFSFQERAKGISDDTAFRAQGEN